ncbi:hypothetical protein ACTXT7_003994 [Hymenolepis weldensis]
MLKETKIFVSQSVTPSYHQFTLDPSVTTFDSFIRLIQQKIQTEDDISISCLSRDKFGEQTQYVLFSDRDFRKALSHSSDMTLRVYVETKARSEESWDIVSNDEVVDSRNENAPLRRLGSPSSPQSRLSVSNSVSTAYFVSGIRSAMAYKGLLQNVSQQLAKTVNSIEKAINFKNEIIPPPPITESEFRGYMDSIGSQEVYLRGMESSVRKVGWRILLGVYPPEFDGKERLALLHSKVEKYEKLKEIWKKAYQQGRFTKAQIEAITLACVDVVRTDRCHPFYYNDGKNRVAQLFNILATYAIYHPAIGYHQGMSNLASLLLYAQGNEGMAYVCLCALMKRLTPKFYPQHDQVMMITQMQHLHDLLVFTDYKMAQFLRMHNLGNMFFTERWLLLELIREFPFEHALHIVEVQWASIAMVAQTWPDVGSTALYTQLGIEHCPAVFEERETHYACCDSNLINSLIGEQFQYKQPSNQSSELLHCPTQKKSRDVSRSVHEGDPVHMKDWVVELPSPDAMGCGNNPFLLFICLSMILEYSDVIYEEVHEVCDLFHLFQTHNKQHSIWGILNRARSLFDAYLKDQEIKRKCFS